jgi:hypothetical protein
MNGAFTSFVAVLMMLKGQVLHATRVTGTEKYGGGAAA